MVRRTNGTAWRSVFAVLVALACAAPALAQTGMVKGVVTDDKGQPVANATVTIQMTGGTSRRFETKTNQKGEFIQIGVNSGPYEVSAAKDKLASAPATVTVRAGAPAQGLNLVLSAASAAGTKEALAKLEQLKTLFAEGVTLSGAGNHDGAIEKFTAAAALNDACYDCYNNIGFSYTQKKEWDQAEIAYKKSIELKADDASAYNGLATVYNAQRKFDLAAEASAKATQLAGVLGAAGGSTGNADALYNQGVILFNGGKAAEAAPIFESAVAANPDHAEAHYMLGMCYAGTDPAKAVSAMEEYLKLAPSGPNAATAKQLVDALKK